MQKIRIIIKKLRKEHFFLIAPLTLSVILISSVAVYLFEHDTTDSSIKTVWDGIWWAFVTICTVGYGDKFPVSNGGKIIGILLMISGIGLLSMLTATVASVLVEQKIKEGKGLETIKASNHTVICGWNGNSEEVLSGIIQQDPARDDLVVLINELPADEFDSLRLRYEKHNMIFLRGNFVHEEVLLRACVHQAKYVLLMADLSGNHPKDRIDDRTILAALTVKSIAPKVKTIAELLDPENKTHLKRANVDEIIVRGEHVGYILASAIGSPGMPRVFSTMLSLENPNKLKRVRIPPRFIGNTVEELSKYYRTKYHAVLIGLLKEKKTVRVEDILSDDSSAIDVFIRKKLQESKRDFLRKEEQIQVILNPGDDLKITEEDHAVILTGAGTREA